MSSDKNDNIDSPVETPPQSPRYLGSRLLIIVLSALMMGFLLGSIDQTIVATAGPTIISDLGGLDLYAWVFSSYIFTQTISMPIFGKLSDLYGRRRFFVLGLAIFMIGSILSGLSQNISELIIFRALQGLGSGAFFPIGIAIIGVVVPPRLLGRLQGAFAAVFGVASVVGPTLGSYIVQAIDWRWIFFINLPLGVISLFLILVGLKETADGRLRPRVDVSGTILLTSFLVMFMLGCLTGGSTFPWLSWEEFLFFSSSGLLFLVFLVVEARATDPVLPLDLFKIRAISSSSLVSILRGVAFIGVITYIPLFVQGAQGGSIEDTRNILNVLLVPMILGTFVGGRLTSSTGYRGITFAGLLIMAIGLFLQSLVRVSTGMPFMMVAAAFAGFGVGITFPTVVIAMQYSVDRKRIGVASSLSQFTSNIGETIGLVILGAIQTNSFAVELGGLMSSVQNPAAASFLANVNQVGQVLTDPQYLAQIASNYPGFQLLIPELRNAFAVSMYPVFLTGFIASIIALFASLLMKGSLKEQISKQNENISDAMTEAGSQN